MEWGEDAKNAELFFPYTTLGHTAGLHVSAANNPAMTRRKMPRRESASGLKFCPHPKNPAPCFRFFIFFKAYVIA
jgi:hypothetical protein